MGVPVTTIHRLHPAPLVCIVCGKPVQLNPDDEWEHTTVDDDLACPVWPVRATENYREPSVPDAAAAYDAALLDRARQLAALHDVPQMRQYLIDTGVYTRDEAAAADSGVVVSYILGALQGVVTGLLLDGEHRG